MKLSPSKKKENGLVDAAVKSTFTEANAKKAGTYVKEQAKDLSHRVREGSVPIRLLALFGAFALIGTSVLTVLGKLVALRLVSVIICIYTFILGCVIIVLEGKTMLPIPRMFETKLYHYALFLKYVWGRGGLYFVTGTLQIAQGGFLASVVGIFMCVLGVMCIVIGKSASMKLAQLRNGVHDEKELKSLFHAFDKNNSGGLNLEEFRNFTESLGLNMHKSEYLTAFSFIDADNGGEISFEEFERWWHEWDFDTFEEARVIV